MRCVHSPTSCGSPEVHALGRTVSKALDIPWMMLSPVTLAVMKPIVAAASAVVEMCPMEITEDMMMLCSNTCVLDTRASVKVYVEKWKQNQRTRTQEEHI